MPYATINELPVHIKKYSTKVKGQWRHVFNTTYAKTKNEVRALKAANSVLKRRFEKTSNTEDFHGDMFNKQVDTWLGNLRG